MLGVGVFCGDVFLLAFIEIGASYPTSPQKHISVHTEPFLSRIATNAIIPVTQRYLFTTTSDLHIYIFKGNHQIMVLYICIQQSSLYAYMCVYCTNSTDHKLVTQHFVVVVFMPLFIGSDLFILFLFC